jgi:3-hydroxyisobutyrate dehydrogenase
MSTVGFVGLGDMGSRMVPHLLRANHRVIVFDVMRDRLDAMTALGAVAADSAAAAVRDADVAISAVMSADIPAAHLGPRGILAGMRPETALAVLSTTNSDMLQSIASQMPAGVHLVDAPLIGGVRYAAEASLTVLLAGPDADPRALREGRSRRAARLGRGLQTDHQRRRHGGRGRVARGPRPDRHSRLFVQDHTGSARPRPDGRRRQASVGSRQSSGYSRFGN